MISFFRIHVPDRIIVLLLVLLLIRLPILLIGTPITIPEMVWLLIGEKISKGYLLYSDIWSDIAPIPCLLYGLITAVAGKSHLALQIAALPLVFFQALLFNNICNRFDVFAEKTFVPALLYLIASSLSFDFLTISPVFLSLTFLLAAFSQTIAHIRVSIKEDGIFLLGAFIGLSGLCQLPTVVFLGLPILLFLLYTGTTFRMYALMMVGFIFPFILVFLYFYWLGEGSNFYYNFIHSIFTAETLRFIDYQSLLVLFIIPTIAVLLGYVKISSAPRFTNFRTIIQVSMTLWLILSLICLSFGIRRTPFQFLIFVPAISFFTTHLFLLIRKRWQTELSFAVYVLLIVFMLYESAFQNVFSNSVLSTDELRVKTQLPVHFENKKILVMGSNLNYYYNNSLATPYLNRVLAERDFGHLDNYYTVLSIYRNFEKDFPDIIIDEDNTLKGVFKRMPVLAKHYEKTNNPRIYRRVN